jgi:hypothetical protein
LAPAEYSSATVPSICDPSSAQNAMRKPLAGTMRSAHQDNGSCALSSAVDVNASAAVS